MELEECLKIFEPIRDLFSNQLADNISGFINISNALPDYNKYNFYIERIRTILKYIHTIPNFVCYSLFAADMRNVKEELLKKAIELMNSLLKCLENTIIGTYEAVIEIYKKMYNMINKKLTTCEEVVEMEKIKGNMFMDYNVIQRGYDDNNKIISYLLIIDHHFSENLISTVEDVYKRQLRYKKESDE